MSLYLDASALVKRYVAEPGSDLVLTAMAGDPEWSTARHAWVEVNLALLRVLPADRMREAMDAFEADWRRMLVVAIDDGICRRAVQMGELTGLRTLDAMHLAAADRVGGNALTVITFDLRMAEAARVLGFPVIGP